MKSLYSSKTIYGTLLGQRVEGTPGNSGSGGSWHRDSIKKQFKAFLFISDVDDKSGPFQFFPKSNYFLNKYLSRNKANPNPRSLLDNFFRITRRAAYNQRATSLWVY